MFGRISRVVDDFLWTWITLSLTLFFFPTQASAQCRATATKRCPTFGPVEDTEAFFQLISPQVIKWRIDIVDTPQRPCTNSVCCREDFFISTDPASAPRQIQLNQSGQREGSTPLNPGTYHIVISIMGAGDYRVDYDEAASIKVTTSDPTFPPQEYLQRSPKKRFRIEWEGGCELSNVQVTASDPRFIISDAPTKVSSRGSAGFDVIFCAELRSGEASEEPITADIEVSGETGAGPIAAGIISVSASVEPSAAFIASPTSLNFGQVPMDRRITRVFSTEATGTETISITATPDDLHFSVAPQTVDIPRETKQEFTVTFDTTSGPIGRIDGKITIVGRSMKGAPPQDKKIELSGFIVPDEARIECAMSTFPFQDPPLVNRITEFSLSYRNTGTKVLNLTSPNPYQIINTSGFTAFGLDDLSKQDISPVGTLEFREVNLLFSAPFGGPFTGTLVILSDDPATPRFECALQGLGKELPTPRDPPRDPLFPVPPGIRIPTFSEWGLAALWLALLAAGTTLLNRRRLALAQAALPSGPSSSQFLAPGLFSKVLLLIACLAVTGLALYSWFFEPVTDTEVGGTLVSALFLAYLFHLLILAGRGSSRG